MAPLPPLLAISVIVIFSSWIATTKSTTVCDEFKYYYRMDNKEHCFDNPNNEWNSTQIIRSWGYTAEEYNIYTEDGYQLLIVRAYNNITKKSPIVIGHGLSQNCSGLVVRNDKSIAKFLGSHGYDIWLINFRGTTDSLGHINKSADNLGYWTFSFHELGYYDIPAVLDLVVKTTNQKPIYLGISLGSTASYVMASTRPDVAKEKLVGIISYASVAYMKNVKSFVKFIAPLAPYIGPILKRLLHGAFHAIPALPKICSPYPFQVYFCETFKGFIFGDRFGQLDPIDAPVLIRVMNNVPIGIVVHYAQLINTGKLQHRNYGKTENLKRYGQAKPPEYEVHKIPVPVTIVSGENDWLGTLENTKLFYSELNESSKCGFHVVEYKKWSHLDFEEAKDIIPYLLEPSLQYLEDLESGRCIGLESNHKNEQ